MCRILPCRGQQEIDAVLLEAYRIQVSYMIGLRDLLGLFLSKTKAQDVASSLHLSVSSCSTSYKSVEWRNKKERDVSISYPL